MSSVVYLDYNATTPYAKEVKEVIISSMNEAWGNPSSSHILGCEARKIIDEARISVSLMIDACPGEIIFTSGGTECNYTVIENSIRYFKRTALNGHLTSDGEIPHIITTNVEHDSIRLHLEKLANEQVIDATFVPVSKDTGQVSADAIGYYVRGSTCLITVMTANNETGIIQPIGEIGALVKKLNSSREMPILFHTDAAQAIGKIPCSVEDLKVDFMTIAGHKFYGPRIGALYVRDLYKRPDILSPVFFGGGQERGYRAGTENVPMIAGLGKAAELVNENFHAYQKQMVEMRNFLEQKLVENLKGKVVFNNMRRKKSETATGTVVYEDVPRLPNTVSVAFREVPASEIIKRTPGICMSAGAACHSALPGVSPVLFNSGVNPLLAACTLRISVGRETSTLDIIEAVKHLAQVVNL